MENSDVGFSFSQDLLTGLSQLPSGSQNAIALPSNNTLDCTWFSGDSQNLSQSQNPIDQLVPSRSKYNVPRWSKGLLKTSDDNQKLKNFDHLVKRQAEDYAGIKMCLQEMQRSMIETPLKISKMIKESTDFLMKFERERQEQLQQVLGERFKEIVDTHKEILEEHFKRSDLQREEDMLDLLAEIKTVKDEIQSSSELSNEDLEIKMDKCHDLLLKLKECENGTTSKLEAIKEEISINMKKALDAKFSSLEDLTTQFANSSRPNLAESKASREIPEFIKFTPVSMQSNDRRKQRKNVDSIESSDEDDAFRMTASFRRKPVHESTPKKIKLAKSKRKNRKLVDNVRLEDIILNIVEE